MRTIIIPALASCAFMLPFAGTAQFITQDWAQRYIAGGSPAGPAGMVTDAAGNVYVTGTSDVYTPQANFVTIKYNAKGVVQWTAGYNSPFNNNDQAAAIAIDHSGNVYVTGTSTFVAATSTGNVMSTVKYSPAGAQLWATTTQIGSISNDPAAMTVDAAGNVYIVGDEVNTPYGYDFMTVKLNTNGVQQWTATYNGTDNFLDYATAVAVDAAGNVYVTGDSWGQSEIVNRNGGLIGKVQIINQGMDYVTIKYNSAGQTVWNNRYNDAENKRDIPTSIALDASGNVYVTGQSDSTALTISYTSAGALNWMAPNNIATNNTAIAIDPSGNVVTAGYFTDNVTISYLVTKYTPAGAVSWIEDYYGMAIQGNGGFTTAAMTIDAQGSIYIAGAVGTTENPQTANFNYATVKYSSAGNQDFVATYNGPSNAADIPTAILLSHPSSLIETMPDVVVTGLGDATSSAGNFTTVRYSQINTKILGSATANDGLTAQADGLPMSMNTTAELSNYPNPFHGATTIAYTLPNDSHVILQIYDVAGQPVSIPIDENETAGPHTLRFNAGRIVPGIYQYRIVARSAQGSFTETKQMLVQ